MYASTNYARSHVRNYIIHIGWIYSVGLMIYLLRNVKYMLQAHNKKYLKFKKIKFFFFKIFAFLLRTLSYPSYSYFKIFVTLCQCILDIIYICTHVYNFNTIEKRHKIILQLMEVDPIKSPNNRLVSSPFHKRKSIP